MIIINPIIILGIVLLLYLAGILFYSLFFLYTVYIFNKTTKLNFGRIFKDCIIGLGAGIIISIFVYSIGHSSLFTDDSLAPAEKIAREITLANFTIILPSLVIIGFSIYRFYRRINC